VAAGAQLPRFTVSLSPDTSQNVSEGGRRSLPGSAFVVVALCLFCATKLPAANAQQWPHVSPATPDDFASATYGPANEACETRGVVLDSSDAWKSRIETAGAAETILLSGGTYSWSGTLSVPAGVTVKPYDCQDARLIGTSSQEGVGVAVTAASGAVVAGLHIESDSHEKLIELKGSILDVMFRNNRLHGGRNDAIVLQGPLRNVALTGNDINSGPAQPGGITSSSGGHVIYIKEDGSGNVPDGVSIVANRIRGSYFGDLLAGDDTIAVQGGKGIVIEGNWFTESYNIENVIDLKLMPSTPVSIRLNYVENNFLGTHGGQDGNPGGMGTCLIVGDRVDPADVAQHVVEGNWIEEHTDTISVGGGSRPGSAVFRYNVIIGPQGSPRGTIHRAYSTQFVNNTFYRSGFKLSRSASGWLPPGLIFKNNIFFETYVNDQTDADPGVDYRVEYNTLYNLPSGFERGIQTDNKTADPQFVDASGRDFRLRSESPARGAGEGGVDMGAFQGAPGGYGRDGIDALIRDHGAGSASGIDVRSLIRGYRER
jgi:hypothetical protein